MWHLLLFHLLLLPTSRSPHLLILLSRFPCSLCSFHNSILTQSEVAEEAENGSSHVTLKRLIIWTWNEGAVLLSHASVRDADRRPHQLAL